MRIPIWPGVRLSLLERQGPERVQVTMPTYYKPTRVLRVASVRGWMLLSVRYDWRDAGRYAVKPLDTPENEAWYTVWQRCRWEYVTEQMSMPAREHAACCVERYDRYLVEKDGMREWTVPDGLRPWRRGGGGR